MLIARTIDEARACLRALPRPLGFVPTMGALHAGHLALADRARRECASVVASIFVNPLQFGPHEDFSRYPRAFEADCAGFAERGVVAVFAPSVAAMYPPGFGAFVDPGPLGDRYEGALRPGHFRGVATVMTKLLSVVEPTYFYMGQKDAQQTAVMRALLRDLALPYAIVVAPTVREPDGLALSSRNVYLDAEQRAAAPGLHRALAVLAAAVAERAADRDGALARARACLTPPLREAYLDVVEPTTFVPLERWEPPAVAIGSAWLGATRLLDNLTIAVPGEPDPLLTPELSDALRG
jgi:pantoate--beta-alanine ligase